MILELSIFQLILASQRHIMQVNCVSALNVLDNRVYSLKYISSST